MTAMPRPRKLYTLDDAQMLITISECATEGHQPHQDISTYQEPTSRFLCRCGMYRYDATQIMEPPAGVDHG